MTRGSSAAPVPPDRREPGRGKRRFWVGAGLAVGVLGVTLAGVPMILGPRVEVVVPHRGPLVHRVVVSGRVLSPGKVELGPLTLNEVLQVFVSEGDAVKAGQLLVQLRDTEQKASLRQAQAALSLARAQYSGVREVSRSVIDASVAEAEAAQAQARNHLKRVEQLTSTGAVPAQELEVARTDLAAAESRLAGATARARGSRGSDSAVAAAQIAQAEANVELAEARLAMTTIIAPANGVVLLRRTEPGAVVQPGATLIVLSRDGAPRLQASTDEKNLTWLRVGQAGQAVADGLAEPPFPTQLNWISPAVDADRGTVDLRFAVPLPPRGLRPDMTVSVNVDIDRRAAALLLPIEAVRDPATDRPWVMVVAEGKTQRQDITVGPRDDGKIEIRSGLSESAWVLKRTGIAEGTHVRAERVD